MNQINSASHALINQLEHKTIIEAPSSECCICKVYLKCYRLSCEHSCCFSCIIGLTGEKTISRYEYQCDACSRLFSCCAKEESLELLEKAILQLKVDEETLRRN